MKEDRLLKLIKAQFRLRELFQKKQEDDNAFKFKPKNLVLTEIDEVIDLSLEKFYSMRIN